MPDPGGQEYFLSSARLGFRTWREEDLPLAIALWGDPDVTALIDARGRLTAEQVRERLLQEIAAQDSHGMQYWPIFLLTNGTHVGCCGLRPYDSAQGILEIGFHLRTSYWGKGLASESARTVMAFAFEKSESKGLFAGHHPENDVSRRLLLKLGFRHTHDELYAPTGLQHPSYILTRDEYRTSAR